MLVALTVLATLGLAACTASPAPGSAGPGSRQPATPSAPPAATAEAASTTPTAAASLTPTAAASPPAAAPSPTPAGAQNLVVTSAEKGELTAAFAAFQQVPVSYEGGGPLPGSVYYAYEPATDTYWARASFISGAYPDPGETDLVMYEMPASNPWIVQYDTSQCTQDAWFPPAVLMAWSMATSPQVGASC